MAPGYGDRGDGTCQLLAIQNSVPPHLTAPAPPQGPSRDLIVELDNTTLTSTSVDGSVGLTVRCSTCPEGAGMQAAVQLGSLASLVVGLAGGGWALAHTDSSADQMTKHRSRPAGHPCV